MGVATEANTTAQPWLPLQLFDGFVALVAVKAQRWRAGSGTNGSAAKANIQADTQMQRTTPIALLRALSCHAISATS